MDMGSPDEDKKGRRREKRNWTKESAFSGRSLAPFGRSVLEVRRPLHRIRARARARCPRLPRVVSPVDQTRRMKTLMHFKNKGYIETSGSRIASPVTASSGGVTVILSHAINGSTLLLACATAPRKGRRMTAFAGRACPRDFAEAVPFRVACLHCRHRSAHNLSDPVLGRRQG